MESESVSMLPSLNHLSAGLGVPLAVHWIVRVLPRMAVICAGGVYIHSGASTMEQSVRRIDKLPFHLETDKSTVRMEFS